MQGVLLAAVVVLTVLVVLDLALSLAIVRRLREERVTRPAAGDPFLAHLVGRPVPELAADTAGTVEATDGTAVTTDVLREGNWFVAFVSVGCSACHDDLPRLKEHLVARRAAAEPALVIVSSESGDGGELAHAVADDALVVVEGGDRPLSGAFGVDGYPTYLQLERGMVVDVHPTMTRVPAPASV